MSCPDKLYINSDHDIELTPLTGFTTSDISDATVTLTKGSTSIVKTLGAGVIIQSSTIYLRIDNTDITSAGIYNVKIELTLTTGREPRGTPCPETLTFNK